MAGILEGLRIIDMGHVVAAPAATAMLADWGAEVIKVEPLSGEMARGIKKIAGVELVVKFDGGETNYYFQLLNRNKRGLAVDLKTDSGRDILYRLVARADAFISNYQMDALRKLKMDYETLNEVNPRLVYGVLTGYGTIGPDKDERGFDYAAAWARSGIQHMIGQPGSPPPPQRGGMMDRVTAGYIAAGILAAVVHRDRTGEGQEVQFSLYHTAAWILAEDMQAALMGTPLPKHDRSRAANPIFSNYRAGDDRWFQLAMLQSDLQWPGFCRAIERPELEKDPRFHDLEAREQNCEELIRILDEIFASKTRDQWEKRFKENDCIYGCIQSPMEVTKDPQALVNDFFPEIDHPMAGPMKVVNTPVKFCQNPASVKAPAPEVGQHTEEILLELGYSWEDIVNLKDKGAIL